MSDDVLASLSHPRGRATVARDEGDLVLMADIGDDSELLLEGYQPGLVTREWGAVEGGVAPPGTAHVAVRAEGGEWIDGVIDNGAWVAFLEAPAPILANPVRFSGDDGQLVERPIPGSWNRTPITDVREACPVCDACSWEQVEFDALDPLREASVLNPDPDPADYIPDRRPRPVAIVRCARCGHVEGGQRSLADPVDSGPDWQTEPTPARTSEEVFARLAGPIYAIRDLPWRLSGWGGLDPITSVDLEHESGEDTGQVIEVRTLYAEPAELRDDQWLFASDALKRLVPFVERAGEASGDGGWTLRDSAHERELRDLTARAARSKDDLEVDGEPTEFDVAALPGMWTAWRLVGNCLVVVSARGFDREAVRLEKLDPTPAVHE